WYLAGLGLFIGEMQAFMAGEEIDTVDIGQHTASECFHEAKRFADALYHSRVFLSVRRISDKAQLPIFGMMQIGEAPFNQGADEVDGEAGAFVSAQEQFGIRGAILQGKARPIDHIAPIARQSDISTRLVISRAGFGVLARKTPDPNHSFFSALYQ